MILRRLQLAGFAPNQQYPEGFTCDVVFPERGIVLVSGANMAGKSAMLVDAPLWACFGETYRGAKATGKVVLEGVDLAVERRKTASTHRLAWKVGTIPGGTGIQESATKAQDALEACISSADRFRDLCVLAARDASRFTCPERQRGKSAGLQRMEAIEALIPGFTRFEPAHERCLAGLRAARQQAEATVREKVVVQERLATEEHRYADATAALERLHDDRPEAAASWREVKRHLLQAVEEICRVNNEIEAVRSTLGDGHAYVDTRVRSLRADQMELASPTCHTCGQVIPDALRERAAASLRQAEDEVRCAQAELDRRWDEAAQKLRPLEAYLRELQTERASLEARERELAVVVESQKRLAPERARAVRDRDDAAAKMVRHRERLALLDTELAAFQQEADELSVCEKVLGTRGVRVQLLARMTEALQAVTNQYLAVLWPGMRLHLSTTRALKDGRERGEVALRIEGVGSGEVETLSGGGLRLLDVALFFARQDLLQAAYGLAQGVTLFDEALDTLAPRAVEAVAELLRRRAERGLVVVISHSKAVWEGLPHDHRWTVDKGVICT